MAKKSFILGSIVGAALTGISIILFAPQDGNELKEELDFEFEEIKEKAHLNKHKNEKED